MVWKIIFIAWIAGTLLSLLDLFTNDELMKECYNAFQDLSEDWWETFLLAILLVILFTVVSIAWPIFLISKLIDRLKEL